MWAKLLSVVILIALGTAGYFSNHFMQLHENAMTANTTASPTAESDPEEIAKRPTVTDFILADAEGKQKKLSDFRGNVVILSFWASWCTPCLMEIPTFAEIEKRYHDRGLRIIAVNVDEGNVGKVFAKDFWAKEKFTFGSYFDDGKKLSQQFDVEMLPSNFVIDRQGRLAFSGFGANDWSNPQTKDFVESLLAEPASSGAASEPGADTGTALPGSDASDAAPATQPAGGH